MIHVLYRDTANTSGFGKTRPSWFSFERCLDSMLRSIDGLDFVKFHLLYDGDIELADKRVQNIVNFKGGSDWNSYVYTWNYAKDLDVPEDDIIFFAENDYMFVKEWPHKIKEIFRMFTGIQYVSLYDHPHFYNWRDYPDLKSYVIPSETHHWKTVPSSTGSVITTKKIVMEDHNIHVSNPSDRGRFEYLGNQKGRSILVPIPSLSTHCEVEWLAPVINWQQIAENKII